MSTRKEEIKVNENIAVNEPKFNEKNTTKFNKDNNNFNERTNNALTQQQDAINKTLDNTLHNVKRTTDEATREIPRYTQRIAEYQEQTIQTIKDIASDFIEAEKEAIGSFQSQVDRNSGGVWDVYNPQRIAENHAVMVNNFTSYLLNTSNLINNALASNIRVYNTALEQTRDNLKAFARTNTNYIKSVEQSVNRYNSDVNTSSKNNNERSSRL
jgi:phage-related protein